MVGDGVTPEEDTEESDKRYAEGCVTILALMVINLIGWIGVYEFIKWMGTQ